MNLYTCAFVYVCCLNTLIFICIYIYMYVCIYLYINIHHIHHIHNTHISIHEGMDIFLLEYQMLFLNEQMYT